MWAALRGNTKSACSGEGVPPRSPAHDVVETHGEKKIGSGSRTRTYDPRINSPLLYQLSYAGTLGAAGGGR